MLYVCIQAHQSFVWALKDYCLSLVSGNIIFHNNELFINLHGEIYLDRISDGLWFVETYLNSTSLANWRISDTLFTTKVYSLYQT